MSQPLVPSGRYVETVLPARPVRSTLATCDGVRPRSAACWRSMLTTLTTLTGAPGWAAEIAKDTLVIVSEMGPNGLDTMVPTANDHSRMVVWQAYDRLVSHGEKKLADGTVSYDAKVMTPEA